MAGRGRRTGGHDCGGLWLRVVVYVIWVVCMGTDDEWRSERGWKQLKNTITKSRSFYVFLVFPDETSGRPSYH